MIAIAYSFNKLKHTFLINTISKSQPLLQVFFFRIIIQKPSTNQIATSSLNMRVLSHSIVNVGIFIRDQKAFVLLNLNRHFFVLIFDRDVRLSFYICHQPRIIFSLVSFKSFGLVVEERRILKDSVIKKGHILKLCENLVNKNILFTSN